MKKPEKGRQPAITEQHNLILPDVLGAQLFWRERIFVGVVLGLIKRGIGHRIDRNAEIEKDRMGRQETARTPRNH